MSKLGKARIKAAIIDLIKEKISASDDLKSNLGRMSEKSLTELHSGISELFKAKREMDAPLEIPQELNEKADNFRDEQREKELAAQAQHSSGPFPPVV